MRKPGWPANITARTLLTEFGNRALQKAVEFAWKSRTCRNRALRHDYHEAVVQICRFAKHA